MALITGAKVAKVHASHVQIRDKMLWIKLQYQGVCQVVL